MKKKISGKTVLKKRIFGVDFSGAKDAGKKIWISEGVNRNGCLDIENCLRARTLPYSDTERNRCLGALYDLVVEMKDCAFGFDFPFGLPRQMISANSWLDFVRVFPENYRNALEFREKCQKYNGSELKRLTDRECKTPFSPFNLRVYKQTYYGIHEILSPLVRNNLASVLPMQEAQPDKPWIFEICPASTLKKLMNLKKLPMYKGITEKHHAEREKILKYLEGLGVMVKNMTMRSEILDDEGGDALDSVIAVYATFQALNAELELKNEYMQEGYVFA